MLKLVKWDFVFHTKSDSFILVVLSDFFFFQFLTLSSRLDEWCVIKSNIFGINKGIIIKEFKEA